VESVPISIFREKSDIKIYPKADYQIRIYTLWENLSTDYFNTTAGKEIESKRAGL
jgi:hypothetical protein